VEVALVRVTAEGETQRVVLGKDRTVIGRQEGCQLRIPIAGVSRTHCEILIQGGSITIKDLGSSNGTYVNQERVTQQPLAPGDLVSLGGQVFLVQVNGEPEEIDAEFLFEDGLPEEESKTSIPAPKASVPAASAAKKADLDDSSVMDFDFEDEDEAQPPL
jgi:pSer/pThr/pTyr-binding forkhead associated (FHA) protein